MIRNYIKIAWRNLFRNKAVSAINVAGLSLGFAFVLLIGGYAWNELRVNQSLKNIGKQYIIQSRWKESGTGPEIATLAPLAESLRRNYPHLVAGYYRWDGITTNVSKGDRHFREEVQVGDSTLLSVFGLELLHGDARTALSDPSAVVITAKAAIKYFGQYNVIGQALRIENFSGNKKDFVISGVLADAVRNSVTGLTGDGEAQVFFPPAAVHFFCRAPLDDWNNSVIVSYITLQEGADIKAVEIAAKQLVEKNCDDFTRANFTAFFMPLKDYYLESNNGLVKKMLYTLFFISAFILFMAVVNFVNISLSKSAGRMREIGVRKVLGGIKKQLAAQFITESIVLVLLSALLSLLIYQAAKPLFEGILGKPINDLRQFPLYFYACLFVLVIVTGLIAGVFPAFVLSSLKVVDALKGRINTISENIFFKKLLVGFQFSIATFILTGAFVISKQVSLFFSHQLGYNKEYTLSVATPRNWNAEGVAHIMAMRNELGALPFVRSASVSYAIPNGKTSGSISLGRKGMDIPAATAMVVEADGRYAGTYGIPLLAGSFLSDAAGSNNEIVINACAAKMLGWADAREAVGQAVSDPNSASSFIIKGVTKDFHFSSMKESIKPLCFISINANPIYRFITLKLAAGNMAENVQALHKKWQALFPGAPFEYRFMDETLAGLYQTEIQLKKAAYTATALSVIIVLLGVTGLISISIRKRIKEIGIRKVLGASATGITGLFLKEFMVVMLLAGLCACPVSYYAYRQWLNDYSYNIDLTAMPFVLPVLLLLAITLLLISVQTLKAAITNPVKNLGA